MWMLPNGPLKKNPRMIRHAKRQFGFFPTTSSTSTQEATVGPVKTATSSASVSTATTTAHVTAASPTNTSTTSVRLVTTSSASTTSSTIATTTSTTTSSTTSISSTSTTSSSTSISTSLTTTSSSIITTPSTTSPASTRTAVATTVTSTYSPSRVIASTTSTTSAAASSTSSSDASSTSTSGIVGIAAGSVIGAAVLIGVIMFFVRRWNRRDDEFDPDAFRRQSMVLQDEAPALRRGNSGSTAPRPPTMFERKNNVTGFGAGISTGYGSMHPSQSRNPFNNYPAPPPMVSYSPGMYVPPQTPAPVMQYANTAPVYSPAYQSPLGSPATISSYGGAQFDAQGQLVRAPSSGTMLNRSGSVAHPQYPGSPPLPETVDLTQGYGQVSHNPSDANSAVLSRNNSVLQVRGQATDADYADLSRASVTPFQAAQYEAISKQLNIPPPMPLQQVNEVDEVEASKNPVARSNSLPVDTKELFPSPFDDPGNYPAQGAAIVPIDNQNNAGDETASTRVTSMPPSLPEISMSERVFSPVKLSFPQSSAMTLDTQGRASPKVDLPPLSPVLSTPQKAQVVSGAAHDGRETPVEIGFAAPVSAKVEVSNIPAQSGQNPKRPETVYDDDDAYGGF